MSTCIDEAIEKNELVISRRLYELLRDVYRRFDGYLYMDASSTYINDSAVAFSGIKNPRCGGFFDIVHETEYPEKETSAKLVYDTKPREHLFVPNDYGFTFDRYAQKAYVKPSKLIDYLFAKRIFTFLSIEVKPKENETAEDALSRKHDCIRNDFTIAVSNELLPVSKRNTILETQSIGEIYCMPHDTRVRTVEASCMQNKSKITKDVFDGFYNEIRDCGVEVSCLYVVNESSQLIGRCLLWKNVKIVFDGYSETHTLMDRIYGSESTVKLFKNHAKKHGYACKEEQSAGKNAVNLWDTNQKTWKLGIAYHLQLDKRFRPRHAPYMDTLRYYDDSKMIMGTMGYNHDISFTSTNGRPYYEKHIIDAEGGPYYCCACSADIQSGEYIRWVDDNPFCEECFQNRYFICPECGDIHRNDCGIFVAHRAETYCRQCFDRLFIYCKECGKHYDKDDGVLLSNGYHACLSCFDEYGYICSKCGEKFVERTGPKHAIGDESLCSRCFNSLYFYCHECGEIHDRAIARRVGGAYYCPDCYDKCITECEICHCLMHKKDVIDHNDGRTLCNRCYRYNGGGYYICDGCGCERKESIAPKVFCFKHNRYLCPACISRSKYLCNGCDSICEHSKAVSATA